MPSISARPALLTLHLEVSWVYIQPHEYLEGGLSEVEERLFLEVALAAGAKDAQIVLK